MNEIIKEEKVTAFNKVIADKNLTILCAESITAGLLASTIASIPGSSKILKGSVVTYQADFKNTVLGVSTQTIKYCSTESIETTAEMVEGLKRLNNNVDIYVAVTGLASKYEGKHLNKKKWGDICVVISYKGKSKHYEKNIAPRGGSTPYEKRNIIREKAVVFILDKILEIVNAA